MQFCKQNSNK